MTWVENFQSLCCPWLADSTQIQKIVRLSKLACSSELVVWITLHAAVLRLKSLNHCVEDENFRKKIVIFLFVRALQNLLLHCFLPLLFSLGTNALTSCKLGILKPELRSLIVEQTYLVKHLILIYQPRRSTIFFIYVLLLLLCNRLYDQQFVVLNFCISLQTSS